jgi:hypothetical protein
VSAGDELYPGERVDVHDVGPSDAAQVDLNLGDVALAELTDQLLAERANLLAREVRTHGHTDRPACAWFHMK